MDEIVIDVETSYLFKEVGGPKNLDRLEVGCAVVYSCLDDSYSIYKQNCINELRQRILAADKVTGFNVWKFDYPVIWGLKLEDWLKTPEATKVLPKTNDLLRRIWISRGLNPIQFTGAHKGYSLKTVCSATLSEDKSDIAEDMPRLLRTNDWDLVVTYCLHDVKLTRELSVFIDKYGYVLNGKEEVVRVWAAPDEVV